MSLKLFSLSLALGLSTTAFAACDNVSSASVAPWTNDSSISVKSNVCLSGSSSQSYDSYDIYADNFSTDKPLVIMIHGGGWQTRANGKYNLAHSQAPDAVKDLVRSGYAVALVSYIGAEGTRSVSDSTSGVTYAIERVIAHSSYNRTKSNSVVLMGTSAGGHLASLVGSTYPIKDKIRAVVSYKGIHEIRGPWSGGTVQYIHGANFPVTFTISDSSIYNSSGATTLTSLMTEAVNTSLSASGNMVGNTAYSNGQTIAAFNSPQNYYTRLTKPHFFVHGTGDTLVSYKQSELANAKLQSLGVNSTYCALPGQNHSAVFPGNSGDACWQSVLGFINSNSLL